MRIPDRQSKLFFIRDLQHLPLGEQLYAALLRDDHETFRELHRIATDADLSSWVRMYSTYGFARHAQSVLIAHGMFQNIPESQRTQLRTFAYQESATQQQSKVTFSKLLKRLGSFVDHVVWIKGAATSTTLYSGDSIRTFSDLDVVVPADKMAAFVEHLYNTDCWPINRPADCNQLGVGPVSAASDLLLAPAPGFIPTSLIALTSNPWPKIDVKLSPLDRGLQMLEIDRFWNDAETQDCFGQPFLVPSRIDQLICAVHTFAKDRFVSWTTMMDIAQIAKSADSSFWEEFVVRCGRESIENSAWASLVVTGDRLGVPIPNSVLDALAPVDTLYRRIAAFTSTSCFVWNKGSILALLVNATTSTDCARKLRLLRQAWSPPSEFLTEYYKTRARWKSLSLWSCLAVHRLILLLPAFFIRHTIGSALWDSYILGWRDRDGL